VNVVLNVFETLQLEESCLFSYLMLSA
jgi:hypothetical protein